MSFNKRIVIPCVIIISVAIVASPVRLILNSAMGATIRTTLITKNLATHTLITQNPKGYPGTGWVPNLGTGDGTKALNKANCQAATSLSNSAGWVWFADANGNGTTNDAEDGMCVATTSISFGLAANNASWNGAINMVTTAASSSVGSNAAYNTYNSLATTSILATNSLANSLVVFAGQSGNTDYGWGIVKANDANSVTVYGNWRAYASYASTTVTPSSSDTFRVFDDYKYDNSWIGDYTCSGNFPNGRVVHHSYPPFPNTSGVGANATTSALEITDCLDGRRDLLAATSSRAVISGTITAVNGYVFTDSSQNMTPGLWMGQKLLITAGPGAGSQGTIEDNASTTITATTTPGSSWTTVGSGPAVGSSYSIIYIIPHGSYVSSTNMSKIFGTADDQYANKGPLPPAALDGWKGTRLPSFHDFFGYCNAKVGTISNTGGDGFYYSSGAASSTALGNYGNDIGRGKNPAPLNNFMNLSNTSSEWLSEQFNYNGARYAGNNACSYVNSNSVFSSYRFRAVFRP